MAKQISPLSVILGGTAAPFVNAFGKAGAVADATRSKIAGVGSTLLKLTGIGGIIAGALGGIGFAAMTKDAAEAIDVNAKLSDRLGVSTEALSALQHAADLSGVSTESLTGGLEKYLKNVAEAVNGNETAAAAFGALGLSADELANLPTDQAIGKIGDALNAIENPAQRAAAAQAIFGKSGQSLLPFLSEGSEGLAAFATEADALGLSFNRLDAGKVEEANDAISRIGAAARGVFRQIVIAIAPAVTAVANAATALGVKIVAGVRAVLPVMVNLAGGLWNIIAGVWTRIWATVGPIVGGITSWIVSNWQMIVAGVASRVAAVWYYISGAFIAVWELVKMVGSGVAATWEWAMGVLGFESDAASSSSAKSFASIGEWFLWLESTASTALVTIGFALRNWRTIAELAMVSVALAVVRLGNQIEYVFTEVAPALLDWFWNNWRDIFTTLASFTAAVFTNMARNVGNFFKALWGWFKGEGFNFDWTPLTEGFKSTIKELPKIAAREVGPLEGALQDQADALADTLGTGFAKALQDNAQVGADAAKTLEDAMKKEPPVSVKPPSIDVPSFDIDTEPAETKLADLDVSAQETSSAIADVGTKGVEALGIGSAEQLARVDQAQLAEGQQPRARYGGILGGAAPATPAVEPPSATASRDARVIGETAQGSTAQIYTLLQQMLPKIVAKPTIELVEAA